MSNPKYKMTPIGELPTDWDTKNIEELCEILDSKRVPLNKQQREEMQGEIPYYGANGVLDYIDDYLFTEPLILMAEDGGYFSEYDTRPIAYKVNGKSWVNNHAHVLKPFKKEVFDWIYYNLVHKNILPFINGGTRAKLNQKDLRRLPIAYPPIIEQQKIAAILSSVDEAIEKTEQIIEQTEKVKKGLMQELLTKGIGHTEFKDSSIGRIPLKWELKQLEEISFINMGQSPSSKDCYDYEKGLPFYQGNADFGDLYPVPVKWCDKPRKVADKDDILISVRAPVGEINIADSECCIGRGLSAIKPKEISHSFLYYLLEYYKKDLERKSQGSTFTAINKGDLTSLILPIPIKEEQIKIVGILENIDNKIFNEKINLKVLNKLKQGLMQELLTGKKRVKVDDSEEVLS